MCIPTTGKTWCETHDPFNVTLSKSREAPASNKWFRGKVFQVKGNVIWLIVHVKQKQRSTPGVCVVNTLFTQCVHNNPSSANQITGPCTNIPMDNFFDVNLMIMSCQGSHWIFENILKDFTMTIPGIPCIPGNFTLILEVEIALSFLNSTLSKMEPMAFL